MFAIPQNTVLMQIFALQVICKASFCRRLLDSAARQLFVFWFYSTAKAKLLSTYIIFQLICHPAEISSLFVEGFLF